MKKMETSEAVDEYESCRSSVISDLDELESNLYSYVHHERNSCFDEEYSTVLDVSSLEGVCQQSDDLGDNENVGQDSSSFTSGGLTSLVEKENSSKSSEINQNEELVDSPCFVTRNESDSSCYVQSSGNDVSAQLSGEKAKASSGVCIQSRDSSPSVLEVSSSDDNDPPERNLSKYRMPATSTPFKECVVIDDSDEEVQIELERVPVKPKKKKKRKKSEINDDIRLNTRSNSELICLDIDESFTLSEKENVDSILWGQDNENSEHEKTICRSWTPQMAQFYDESWGGEGINVSELQRTMSDDGWKVDISDEFSSLTSKFQNRRYFGVKSKAWCTKCNQKGHYRNECTEKISPPRCHRCGSSRHQEYSCNQKICLTCGRFRPALVAVCQQCRRQSWKKCYICEQPGHPPGCCPDLWRRFHATIVPGEIVAPQKVPYKDPKNTYCCNCASRGHHVFQCKMNNNFSDYAPMNPKVTSYVDPEALFQDTCNRTSTNWDNVGAIAPEYQNEDREKHSRLDRGIKRPKHSGNQQKSKQRKLSENNAPMSASTEIGSQKNSKNCDKSVKRNEIKQSVKPKIKKGLRPEKNFCKQDKRMSSIDNKNHPNWNSELERDKHMDTSTMKGPSTKTGIKEKETTAADPKTGFVERIVVLSPGHLKRIESEEGKEILKYVTDQHKGVTARVVSNPSGVLRLMGAGNSIEHVKANLFDILNNKYGLDQLKQSIYATGNDIQVKKPNKRTQAALLGPKDIKKKFQNEDHHNNQLEMKSKDRVTIAVSNSGRLQEKISNNKCRNEKKRNVVCGLKCSLKNGKGNKLNRQGKQLNRRNALRNDRGDCTRISPSFNSAVHNSTNTRYVSSSKVSKYKEGVCEILHNLHQANEEVTYTVIARPGPSHSEVKFNGNRNKCKKRNKNKGKGDKANHVLRIIKQGDGKNRMCPAINQAKKRQKKISNDMENLGLITVEVGHNRKVFLDEHNTYGHSRTSTNQQCS